MMNLPTLFKRHSSLMLALLLSAGGFSHAASVEYYDAAKWLKSTDSENTKRMLTSMFDIKNHLQTVSHIEARLLISDDESINAFATESNGEKLIVFNIGLLDAFEDDRDAIAAVYAHELAHHAKNHISNGKATSAVLGILGAIAGAALDRKLGGGSFGSHATDFATTLVDRKFGRDQEREADSVGMPWLVEAGYNPEGALRLHRALLAGSGNDQFSMMQTHPTSTERIERLEKWIHEDAAAMKLAKVDKTRLYEEVPEPKEEAEATKIAEPDPKLLEPIEGVSFDDYAALSNELAFNSDANAVYRKHNINAAKYQRINEGFIARMKTESGMALASHYNVRFMAASQGPYAKYGKDVAQAASSGALKEPAPISLEQYVAINQLLVERPQLAADPKAYTLMLKPYKLSSYEWMLVSNWWARKLNEDETLRNRYVELLTPSKGKS
ncbi:M48 family metalloprotease [Chitinimonas sp.]|uniref:M48 family metalloprotease n=1 Tax=Chitinimonas sp. TaxID=1934313 RepID=UPI0035B4B08C